MNIHHLELFYYVAKHGGISQAVRNMPYGIQQPAVSGQIIQLEESLGSTLFQRRPFSLTPAGQELYNFIGPFFDNLNQTADRLRGGVSQHIRIGASEIVLRDYLPAVLREVRKQFPGLKPTLREGYQPQLEGWLLKQELDLAVTLLDGKLPAGANSLTLFELPLVLLVQKGSKLKDAKELWRRDRIEETLISLPPNEPIHKNFQRALVALGVDWFIGIEVSSVNLVESYVANGYGIGLSVAIPRAVVPAQLRALPLPGFSPVTLGLIWHGKLTPVAEACVNTVKRAADLLTSSVPGAKS